MRVPISPLEFFFTDPVCVSWEGLPCKGDCSFVPHPKHCISRARTFGATDVAEKGLKLCSRVRGVPACFITTH